MRLSRTLFPALASAAVALAPGRAGAVVLSEDPMSGDSIELGGTVRTFTFILHGGPLDLEGLPSDQSPMGSSLTGARLRFEMKRDSLSISVHDELTSVISSAPGDAAGTVVLPGQATIPPMWLPLDANVVEGSTLVLRNRVDRLFVRYLVGPATFTLGRQPITLGRAVLWTPIDLLAPFSPLEIDPEFKPGVDALRADVRLAESVALSFISVIGRTTEERSLRADPTGSAALGRMDLTLETTRIGLQGGFVRGDVSGGGDFFVDLGSGFDLHGEATIAWPIDPARRPFGHVLIGRAVLGSTFKASESLTATLEAHWNSGGAEDPEGYLEVLADDRYKAGEIYALGRYYAGLAADWEIMPLLHFEGAVLGNLRDPSALIAPTLRYSAAANAQITAGAFIPIGKGLELDAIEGPTAHSEFGLYPFAYHLDAKLYF